MFISVDGRCAGRVRSRHLAVGLVAALFAATAALPLQAATTFSNTTALALPGSGTSGPASLYPSPIVVSGLSGEISSVIATLDGFSHTFPADMGFLLVGPGGQSVVLMNALGGSTDVVDVTLTFDDAAPGVPGAPLTSGTYRPFNNGLTRVFPAPAPGSGYGTTLSEFDGLDPNGTWNLFAHDFLAGDVGTLSRGWSVTIATDGATVIPLPAAGMLLVSGLALLGLARRRRAA